MHYMGFVGPDVTVLPPVHLFWQNTAPKVIADRCSLTKLLNAMFARGLTKRVPPSSPLVDDSVNPDFCHSAIRRNFKFPRSLIGRIMKFT
jgi:hypothetical protein